MKLRYDCQVYNIKGFEFTILPKGKEVRVLQVDRKSVKIEWDREIDEKYKTGFGYISHRQFIICVDKEEGKAKEVKKNNQCKDCLKFGNCGKSRIAAIPCEYFEEREDI